MYIRDIVKYLAMRYPERDMSEAVDAKLESLSPEERIARLEKENQELKRLAGKDALTGLDNLRTFNQEIHRAIAGALRSGKPVSLILTDIENFKILNDLEGHPAGDRTLIQVAAILKQGIRETDRACRYGGDEFIIILPDTATDHAVGVAERLRKMVEASTIVTASFGVSSFTPSSLVTQRVPEEEIQREIDQLIETADKAMYEAKRTDGNSTGGIKNGKIFVLGKSDPSSPKMVVKYQKSLEPALKS